ncbi:hypothetical protein Leryth_019411 [Lithospermum erythrorhizon]|nr:hypothetical protein Leryth_019411 [Lithospermum erythrorhizon]
MDLQIVICLYKCLSEFFVIFNSGFPLWLHFIEGIKLRTDNKPFKVEMQRFTAKIVDLMKQEKLYASQGGPIILSQIYYLIDESLSYVYGDASL